MATSTSSIGGLASGLDTASIIDQLMALEAAPQTKLKTKVTTTQSVITALQTLNTKVSVVASKAEALAKSSAWSPIKATSSNSAVTVTASTSAQPTSLSMSVNFLATTHQVASSTAVKLEDAIPGAAGTMKLERVDGSTVDITSDGTLKGVVAAINAKTDAGVRASAIKVSGDGSTAKYQLLLESTTTGAAQQFHLTDSDGVALSGFSARNGRDAEITVGTGLGLVLTSATNTFKGVVDGVDITLSDQAKQDTTATIAVSRDGGSLATQVQSLVDSLNSALDEISTQTAYNAETSTAGKLLGDSAVRSLRDSLLGSIYPTNGTSLASIGIQTTRDGKLTFDAAKFTTAYNADPVGVADKFTTEGGGFASRLEKVAKAASNSTTGTITSAITGRKSEITRLNENIDAWDLRLELRRTTLERQYTALETAMSSMSSQSSWLSAQIDALNADK